MTEPIGTDQHRLASTIDRAVCLAEAGQLSRAAYLLFELATHFPEAASVHAYLGWFLLQLDRTEEALGHSRHATQLAPHSEKASLIYFHVMWKSGKYIDALDEMKRFLMIRPSQVYTKLINDWKPLLSGNADSD